MDSDAEVVLPREVVQDLESVQVSSAKDRERAVATTIARNSHAIPWTGLHRPTIDAAIPRTAGPSTRLQPYGIAPPGSVSLGCPRHQRYHARRDARAAIKGGEC